MLHRFSAKSECTCKAFIYSELSGESFAECIDFLFRALKEPIFLLIFKKYHNKVNQVDWFYIVQMLTHIPVGLFALYFVDFIGLKKSFWISTSLNVIGTGLRLGRVIK